MHAPFVGACPTGVATSAVATLAQVRQGLRVHLKLLKSLHTGVPGSVLVVAPLVTGR